MRIAAIGGLAALAFIATGCETPDPVLSMSERGISIPYDLWDYNPNALDAEARRHCGGFGKAALFAGETTEGRAVRWRYRHYECV